MGQDDRAGGANGRHLQSPFARYIDANTAHGPPRSLLLIQPQTGVFKAGGIMPTFIRFNK